MKYLMGGYYGWQNVGDDLLLYVTIAGVARVDGDAEFTVVSSVPVEIPPGTKVTLTSGSRRFETTRQLLHNDVWLFGGGGLLQDRSERSLQSLGYLRHRAWMAKMFRRKIVALGLGIGPLVTAEGRKASRDFLYAADLVTVRDQASLDLALAIAPGCRVELAGDLVPLLPEMPAHRADPPDGPRAYKTLGVSLLAYHASLGGDTGKDLEMAACVAEALNQVLRQHPDWEVKLFEFFSGSSEYGDAVVLRHLEKQLAFPDRVHYRPYRGDGFAVYRELAECEALFGMRFHSCLLSYLAEVPCLMINYHPKCSALARILAMSDEAVVDLGALGDSPQLYDRLHSLLEDGARFRPPASARRLSGLAARNLELFADWLGARGNQAPRRNREANKLRPVRRRP